MKVYKGRLILVMAGREQDSLLEDYPQWLGQIGWGDGKGRGKDEAHLHNHNLIAIILVAQVKINRL